MLNYFRFPLFLVLIITLTSVTVSCLTLFLLLLWNLIWDILDRWFLLRMSLLNMIWIDLLSSFFQLLLIVNFLKHRLIVVLISNLNCFHWLLLLSLLWSLLHFLVLALLHLLLKFLYHLILMILILSTLHLSERLLDILRNSIRFLS